MKKAKRKILLFLCTSVVAACSAVALTACGDNEQENPPPHTHTYDKQVAENKYLKSDATCTEKAKYYLSCECGERGEETFEYGDVAPHEYKLYVYNNDATCTENGTETARCENCFEGVDTREKKDTATGHEFVRYFSDNNGTCVKNGTETAKCEHCSETDTREKANSYGLHIFENGKCTVCDADEYTQELTFSLNDDKQSYTVYGSYGETYENVIIPKLYYGVPVTHIGAMAFPREDTLISITIPDSVTSIGEDAFAGCRALKEIRYGGDVAGWCAVDGLENLMKESADEKILFFNGVQISDIVIPEGVKNIGAYTFCNCGSIIGFTIPEGVESIGERAFVGCSSVTAITVPESVTQIGEYAFNYCNALTIYCKAEAKPDGWDAKWNSQTWTLEGLPVVWNCTQNDRDEEGYAYSTVDGVRFKLKDGNAFVVAQPRDLITAKIPESVHYLYMDYKVSYIDGSAFANCDKLTTVKIAVGIKNIYGYAFDGCESLTDINFEGTKEQWGEIKKNANWDKNTGNYTIHCTDGDIAKS